MSFNPSTRHQSRILAMQALFCWEYNRTDMESIISLMRNEYVQRKADIKYFESVLRLSINNIREIDSSICEVTKTLKAISSVELSILRISVCEMIYKTDTPKVVSINEAVKIAKKFSSTWGYKYINAILNRIASSLD